MHWQKLTEMQTRSVLDDLSLCGFVNPRFDFKEEYNLSWENPTGTRPPDLIRSENKPPTWIAILPKQHGAPAALYALLPIID